jgi:hypothetical protein
VQRWLRTGTRTANELITSSGIASGEERQATQAPGREERCIAELIANERRDGTELVEYALKAMNDQAALCLGGIDALGHRAGVGP